MVVLIWRLCQVKDSQKKHPERIKNLEDWRGHKKTLRHPHPQNTQKNKQQQKNWKSRRKTSNRFFSPRLVVQQRSTLEWINQLFRCHVPCQNRPPSLELRTSVSRCQPVEHLGSVFKTIQATCWMVGNWWKQKKRDSLEEQHVSWKIVVGRLLSFWNGPFLGDMLVFRDVVGSYLPPHMNRIYVEVRCFDQIFPQDKQVKRW